MDLTKFINPNQKKHTYKISFKIANEKITKFISAYSEQSAKALAEQDIKKEHPNSKIAFIEIKELTKSKEV